MKSIEYEIGFSDSEVTSYYRDRNGLTVNLTTWNEVPLKLVFKDVIAVSERDVGDIANVCESDTDSPILIEALNNLYEDAIDPDHGYHHYLFINNDDIVVLEVIAQSLTIDRSN